MMPVEWEKQAPLNSFVPIRYAVHLAIGGRMSIDNPIYSYFFQYLLSGSSGTQQRIGQGFPTGITSTCPLASPLFLRAHTRTIR